MGFTIRFTLGIILVFLSCTTLKSANLGRHSRQLNETEKLEFLKNETTSQQKAQNDKKLQNDKIKNVVQNSTEHPTNNSIISKLIKHNTLLENKPKTDVKQNPNVDDKAVDLQNKIIPNNINDLLMKNTTVLKLEKSEPYNRINQNGDKSELIAKHETSQNKEITIDQAKTNDSNRNKEDDEESSREYNGKSIDIEKYVSQDFHNINNVYTFPISPDTEKYINHDYDHYAASSTYEMPDYTKSYQYSSAELTTPKSSIFDDKFKEAVYSVDQKLEHIDSDIDESEESKDIPEVNLQKYYNDTRQDDGKTKAQLNFINYNKIIGNDTNNKNSIHKDLIVEEVRNLDFRSSYNDTQIIDESPADNQNNSTSSEETDTDKLESENDSQDKANMSDIGKIETSTTKSGLLLTTRKSAITKPTTNSNTSHISILSNKIETETIKALDLSKSYSITTAITSSTTEYPKSGKTSTAAPFTKTPSSRGTIKFLDYTKPIIPESTTIKYPRNRNRNKLKDQSKQNKTNEQFAQENQVVPVQILKTPAFSTEKILEETTTQVRNVTEDNRINSRSVEVMESTTMDYNGLKSVPLDFTASTLKDKYVTTTESEAFPAITTSLPTASNEMWFSVTDNIITSTSYSSAEETTTLNSVTTTSINPETTTYLPINTETSFFDNQMADSVSAEIFQDTTSTTSSSTTEVFDTSTKEAKLVTTESTTEAQNVKTTETVQNQSEIETTTSNTWQSVTDRLNTSESETETTTADFLQLTTENNLRTSKSFSFNNNNLTTTQKIELSTTEMPTTVTVEPKIETTTTKLLNVTSKLTTSIRLITPNYSFSNISTTTKANLDETVTDYEDPDDLVDEDENRKEQGITTTTTELVFMHIENVDNHTTLLPEIFKPEHNYPMPDLEKSIDSDKKITEDVTVHPTESDELVNSPEDNSGTIAAIVISCVGAICLIILAGLLFVMRKRQKRFNYGQRCRPVNLDDYSMDNISVYNSVRRKGVVRSSKRSYGNPGFEDPASVSHPLNFPALGKFANNLEDIRAEFEEIPQITARTNELPEGCDTKNRYANVIPLPETRVHLKVIDGYPNSDYINANYVTGPRNIKGYYIACQAPLQNTIDDFWRMIWEQQSKVILMLTHLFENGVEKSTDYLPPSEVLDCHRLFGDFQVTLKKREVKDKYIISTLQLKNMVSNSWREVTHLWYLGWPDKGVPSEANSLIAFLIEARSYMKSHSLDKDAANGNITNGSARHELNPVVVHCSPGTGRTGVVIACDIAIREFEQNRLVDIPRIVYRIRRDRASSVQTKDQYSFIYKVISLYATKLTGGVLDSL